MTHKEFCIWLDGFMNGRSGLNASDIHTLKEKLSSVENESEDFVKKFVEKNQNTYHYQYNIKKDNDNLGKPPKIVM